MEEKLTKKQIRDIETAELIKTTVINTQKGKEYLGDLIINPGVRNKIQYFNIIEKLLPKKERTVKNRFKIQDVTHDYGLLFNDGMELKHISKNVYNFIQCEVLRKRERNPNL